MFLPVSGFAGPPIYDLLVAVVGPSDVSRAPWALALDFPCWSVMAAALLPGVFGLFHTVLFHLDPAARFF